ncbi:GTP-binding protein [Shewanella xiamenensis]|uniref:CobW family GTP-binding protein n=1 Tax=Shewanella xiamenensis TaxID=332186 RepID=UPI00214FEEB8|nr:GTP-binding protein [Shewanella xiamenensis]MCR4535271.1 GTP-binding protein [Shewanella xiamenensis]MDI5875232.1 GTP-binding protein [Shewanella xiamenensis]MEE1980403.1 GTP-binding protein [Shewanella xiamenensis]WHF54510.1 GTP-binding protein [Shewanella xiamenensis]
MIVKAIPTNIITGFLGVGKTSLIKQLLKTKPEGETWAVLVNEFGEVGIDAGLLATNNGDVQIREVAGGCMCCAAGVPTQVAINQLIARAKPDRLLIEPTGLGHPNEIIKVLSAPHYQHVIRLQSTLCLIDARKLMDERYRGHDNFIQQLQVADVIVTTKTDLYPEFEALHGQQLDLELAQYLNALQLVDTPVVVHSASQGLSTRLLEYLKQPRRDLPRTPSYKAASVVSQPQSLLLNSAETLGLQGVFAKSVSEDGDYIEPQGRVRKQNQGEGCFSCGWVFNPLQEFDFDKLMQFISEQTQVNPTLLRVKAVMITSDGIAGINWSDGDMAVTELDDSLDSRLEMIATQDLDWDRIEQALVECLVG